MDEFVDLQDQLADYVNLTPVIKVRRELDLRLNGFFTLEGREAILLDVHLENYVLAVSYDGHDFYLHVLTRNLQKDVTTPQRIVKFDDHMRSWNDTLPLYCNFLYMVKIAAALDREFYGGDLWQYNNQGFIDGRIWWQCYYPEYNYNISDRRTYAEYFVKNVCWDNTGEGKWVRYGREGIGRNQSYSWN